MQSQGRQHLPAGHPSLLLDTKLANWGRADVLQDRQHKWAAQGPALPLPCPTC
jgi:hypothetical protein